VKTEREDFFETPCRSTTAACKAYACSAVQCTRHFNQLPSRTRLAAAEYSQQISSHQRIGRNLQQVVCVAPACRRTDGLHKQTNWWICSCADSLYCCCTVYMYSILSLLSKWCIHKSIHLHNSLLDSTHLAADITVSVPSTTRNCNGSR